MNTKDSSATGRPVSVCSGSEAGGRCRSDNPRSHCAQPPRCSEGWALLFALVLFAVALAGLVAMGRIIEGMPTREAEPCSVATSRN